MIRSTFAARRWRLLLTVMFAGVLLPLFGVSARTSAASNPAVPQAVQPVTLSQESDGNGGDDNERTIVYGTINVMPQNTLVGDWTIDGKVYTTTDRTEFDQEEGQFAVGVCAKVQLKKGTTTVLELDSEPAGDCNDDGDDDGAQVKGKIDSMPAGTLIGTWVISGTSYTATEQTVFDQTRGAFAVGVCVEGELAGDGSLSKLASKSADDCNRNDDDDDDDDDDNDGREFRGFVDTRPENTLVGQWTIAGKVYTVTEQTEVKQKFGQIEVGTCVKGELSTDGTYVRELQSKRDVVCKHSDHDDDDDGLGKGELYAKLVSFPEGLIGDWVVGSGTFSVTVKADANTEFDQEKGPFKVGETVKVEFVILQDGTFLAKEIKSVYARHDDDDDDNGDDDGDVKHHGVAFGVIDSRPQGSEGDWLIGGITYTVSSETRLDPRHGALDAGRNVRVKFWVDDAGNRTAREIKSMPPTAGNPTGLLKLVGFVQAMPSDSFVGEWSVGGVVFVADDNSKFEEEDGLLDIGTFVEVKYRMQNGVRLIVEMESHVLPGGGDDDHIGKVKRMDDSMSVAGVAVATWNIDGRTYVVSDATLVGMDVSTDSTVLVNSYKAADGSQVATSISNITLSSRLYLPSAAK